MCRLIGDALRGLRTRKTPSDETVHQARKKIKRARASLRLLRDAIGEPAYGREYARLRDAARPLSHVRDARVALESLERFLAGEHRARTRDGLARLRRELRRERLRLRRELQGSEDLKETCRSLVEAGHRAKRWRLSRDDLTALIAGIRRIYRKGRKALAQAESDGSDESLHEARKQVKYFQQTMEVIEPVKEHRLAKLIKRAESIGDRLGDHHDLAVLGKKIAALPADSAGARKILISHVAHRREKLQSKAMKKARRFYRRKAKAFGGHLETKLAADR
jgi:CHAD domain-containing protein